MTLRTTTRALLPLACMALVMVTVQRGSRMFWKLVWRGHADDRHDRLCPWLRLLLRTHCISDALCSRGCDRLSACEHLRHMQTLAEHAALAP